MDRVVVSIGGSIFLTEAGPDPKLARGIATLLEDAAAKLQLFVVVGGGATARRYIAAARELGLNEADLDDLGIEITRVNARVLIAGLPEAYHRPALTLDEALAAGKQHRIVVMGGTHPGHTTDAVAAMMAEKTRAARLVIATNVDGVYDSDPRKNARAKLLKELTGRQLVEITIRAAQEAGSAGVIDPLGAKIVARSKVPCRVVNGRNLDALRSAILGKPFPGSTVRP